MTLCYKGNCEPRLEPNMLRRRRFDPGEVIGGGRQTSRGWMDGPVPSEGVLTHARKKTIPRGRVPEPTQ
jgi:hypothetical protein